MSGTALHYFAKSQENNHEKRILEFTRSMGKPQMDDDALNEFLREVSVEDILKYTSQFEEHGRTLETIWSPVLEGLTREIDFITIKIHF